ncbi:MAG TPA: threonine ammonia-lyase [Actinomycetota bacterium]|nr:threonine ammonia-lyase [Actinomycetota bacterium]
MKTRGLVGIEQIEAARDRLRDVAVETPLDRSRALSEVVGGSVFVKCENLQRTGSFKIRGAYNLIAQLDDEARARGVVAASAGNHAQGVALAAKLQNTRSTVFMPAAASLPKIEATKRYGAEVVLTGKDFGEAFDAAITYAEERGEIFVHPFDHADVIAGQGTIGCEIAEALPTAKSVVVPIGGGGLISGIAAALKALLPAVRVVGVQAKGAAAFPPSLAAGSPIRLEELATIADGIAVKAPGDLTLEHVSKFVDDVVTVSEEALAEALVFSIERMKLVLEPAGAAGVAAVLSREADIEPPAVVLLSGGNIDPLLLLRVIRFGLGATGRYFAFHTTLADSPGELHRLLGLIANLGANVVGVEHRREGVGVRLDEVDVAVQVETRGRAHIDDLKQRLAAAGYLLSPI